MFLILEIPETCRTDLLGGRCRASLFDRRGYGLHTNCQDTLSAAIGEYDLTPDDVHDSLNLWMNTEWDSVGTLPCKIQDEKAIMWICWRPLIRCPYRRSVG